MPIFENLLSKFGYMPKEKGVVPSVLASTGGIDPFAIWRTSRKIDPAKALEVYTGWVYAAIRAIGMDVGGMQHRLFQTGKDRDKELFNHDILDLLGAVNDYQTGFELKYTIVAHLEATGNAYIFLEGVTKPMDKPFALHMMNPAKMKVLVDREQFPARIQGYRYTLGTKIYDFQPYQLIHIKYVDPSDPFEGVGTVQNIAQWVDSDNNAMEFNRQFFLNGARIGGFLETDAAHTPDQLAYLKTSFEAAFTGIQNAYKVLALPKGVKYEEGGKTQKDLDFPNLMDMMRDRIIAGFKVPRTALGITDDVNRANAEATDYVFAARTIKPIMTIINSYLNEFLVPRYGSNLYLDFKDPVPEDRALRMEEMAKATGGAPVMSANEAREEYFGLDPVEGGDAVMIPFNLAPLGSPEKRTEEQQNNAPSAARKTRFAMNSERRQSITKTIAEKAAAEVAKIFKDADEMRIKSQKNLSQLSDDDYETIYKGFAVRVNPYEKRVEKALQEFNAKQRKEVIANIPRAVKAIDKDDLFDKDQSMTILVDLMKPLEYDLAGKEGKAAALLLGIEDMDILTPEVRKALDKATKLLSKSYNDTTRDLLKAKLEQGLKEGLSQDQLGDLVNAVYDYSDEVRALAVARTETFRIANYATQEAWKQSGIVKSQRWYTAADERVCPYCGPLHGKVISIDDDFFKKGDTVTGSDGAKIDIDYADVDAPPLHVNCRCYIRPEDISIQ